MTHPRRARPESFPAEIKEKPVFVYHASKEDFRDQAQTISESFPDWELCGA
jgi:hypothetical protein